MSKNTKIKGGVILLGFLFFQAIEWGLIILATVQLVSFCVERVVNVWAGQEFRTKLHQMFPKWSTMDDMDRIKFKRPLAFIWKKVKEFFMRDFEAEAAEEDA